jgi:hypothetical protein
MFKKMFYAVVLLATATAYGGDALMEIRVGIGQVNKLLNPRKGRDPLPWQVESAHFLILENMDTFAAYKTMHPDDVGNPALCAKIQKVSSQLLANKHTIQDNNRVFLG